MAKKKASPDTAHHHYSGPKSRVFWSRVARLRDDRAHEMVYWAGVLLQEMESRILAWLQSAEEAQSK